MAINLSLGAIGTMRCKWINEGGSVKVKREVCKLLLNLSSDKVTVGEVLIDRNKLTISSFGDEFEVTVIVKSLTFKPEYLSFENHKFRIYDCQNENEHLKIKMQKVQG